MALSAGTIASVIGSSEYDAIDAFQTALVEFASRHTFANWQEAIQAFIDEEKL